MNGESEKEQLLKTTEVDCNRRKVQVEQDAYTRVRQAEASLEAAKKTAEATLAEAHAEEKGAQALEEKRNFELEWEKLDILQNIASQ